MKGEWECRIAAIILGSGRVLAGFSNCAALIAGAGLLLGNVGRPEFAVSLAWWPVACYFAVRVAVDERLFRELSEAPEEGGKALDEILRITGLAAPPAGRPVGERSRGAIRLWKRLIVAVALQGVSLAAALAVQVWGKR